MSTKGDFTYPDNLASKTGGGDESHWVLFTSYPQLFAQTTSAAEYSIALPMGAQALISSSEAVYAEQEGLGTVLTEASGKVAAGIADYAESGGGMPDFIAAFKDINYGKMGEAAGEHALSSTIKKSDLLKRALGGSNIAINPKMSLLYQGPGKFRKFVFEFPMIAKNEGESETIKEIIKAFRLSTLPGYADPISNLSKSFGGTGTPQSGTGGTVRKKGAGSNFYTFPSTWDIRFGHARGADEKPFKIARSVCNSVIANYAAAGVPFFFRDGSPFEIKLTVSFTEIVIITKELVDQGF
tara:strand:- start:3308 stop:4198 length:891 start_codon:yes stop_codon:yes gene_type:complete